jgi:hypothetical protein
MQVVDTLEESVSLFKDEMKVDYEKEQNKEDCEKNYLKTKMSVDVQPMPEPGVYRTRSILCLSCESRKAWI